MSAFIDGFYQSYQTTRMHFLVLRDITKTARGTRQLLMAVLAHTMDRISSCHILKAQNCCLSTNSCFIPPLAPLPPSPPSYLPPHSKFHLLIHKDSIHDSTGTEKLSKNSNIQVACKISYKIIATYACI